MRRRGDGCADQDRTADRAGQYPRHRRHASAGGAGAIAARPQSAGGRQDPGRRRQGVDLQIQTCENRGCYSNTPVSPEMLAALQSGKQLKIAFQNLNKEVITIPTPLADFAAAYEKIK
jgi:hypothetical protein